MTDYILAGVVAEAMLEKVISVATEQISHAWGFKEELTQLRDSFTMIQAVLADAKRRQVTEESMRDWFQRIANIAYDADSVLDELAYEILRRKVEIRNQMKRKVFFFFTFSNPIVFFIRMDSKFKNIRKLLKDINVEVNEFGHTMAELGNLRLETDPFLDLSEVVGREDDVSRVVDLILAATNQLLSVIPIVGMAGLGKTTLAKLVYNHELVKKHFDKIMWVCVSDDFNDKKILKGILEYLTHHSVALETMDAILECLKKELQGKRFLLILDDVWNEDPIKWDTLRSRLLGISSNIGNCIIVTTCSDRVAKIMETLPHCRLGELSDDQCWSIIERRVSLNGRIPLTLELEAIGSDIAKKCGGFPLLAKILGGVMSRKKEKSEWLEILNNSEVYSNEMLLPMLKSSFDRLPSPSVKQCFAYCSTFPKDYMKKDELIQLWMAEGFLQPQLISSMMEDIGNHYFDILLANSFFQDVQEDECGHIVKCKMLDMIHNFAHSISKFETLIWKGGSLDNISQVCRLVIHSNGETALMNSFPKDEVRKLHTLVLENATLGNTLSDFKCLRVLKLYGECIRELPSSVGQLIHLRLLNISRTSIEALPKSITKLYSLQTLRIEYCHHLKELPEDLINLINLRHICVDHDYIKRTPKNMGKLIYLQTLPFFSVCQDAGLQIKELGNLDQLRGELDIYNLQHVKDKKEAQSSNLEGKEIHKLRFFWSRDREYNNNNDEEVLEGLQPHQCLKSLTIEGFQGKAFPSWLLTTRVAAVNLLLFVNLIDINLRYCSSCKEVPTLGHLPRLRVLQIIGMCNVTCIGTRFYSFDSESTGNIFFPALRRLELKQMYNLVEWKDASELATAGVVFPCLEELTIEECHQLTSAPCDFPHLQKLWISKIRRMAFKNISSKLTTLTSLYIKNVSELAFLPEQLLENNEGLKSLQIRRCHELETIYQDALRTILGLEKFIVESCPNLRSLPSIQGIASFLRCLQISCGDEVLSIELQLCASLSILMIKECPNLTSIPNLQELYSLVRLEIENCPKLISIPSLQGLNSLSSLEIENCPKLISIPSLQGLNSLSSLEIFNCQKLMYLTEGLAGLHNLETLAIGGFCEELETFPSLRPLFEPLDCSLKQIYLYGWTKLNSLPDEIKILTALTSLWILEFHGIEALPDWLGSHSTLKELYLNTCNNLMYLPTLECLIKLEIINCPKLKKRYAKETGAEWFKISHIPNVRIY